MVDYFHPLDTSYELGFVYIHSLADLPGVAGAPNVFSALFNPLGSGKIVLLGGVNISCAADLSVTSTAPMRGFRITASSGGTLVAASDICKKISAQDDPVAALRIGNPTVTLGPAALNSPPVVATAATGASQIHDVNIADAPLVLVPGEGVCLRTADGDADQRWSISVVWGERRA